MTILVNDTAYMLGYVNKMHSNVLRNRLNYDYICYQQFISI